MVLAGLLATTASSGSAMQTARSNNLTRDVLIERVPRPYRILGNSAENILDQLAGNADRAARTRFSIRYSSSHAFERLTDRVGQRSGLCRLTGLSLRISIDGSYPEWEPDAGSPGELFEAWKAFAAQLEPVWKRYERVANEFVNGAYRWARRSEEPCPLLASALTNALRSAMDEALQRAPLDDVPPRRWPPPGFENLLRDRSYFDRVSAPPPASSAAVNPKDLLEAVERDIGTSGIGGRRTVGLVTGMSVLGSSRLDAYGTVHPTSLEPLETDAVFPFPDFTKILIAVLADVLHKLGTIDLQKPIASYLPGIDPEIGAVTLQMLLSNQSGLDDRLPPDSTEWDVILDRLDSRALFTRRGSVQSRSRYSFPLAARVIERGVGQPLAEALERYVFGPLQMDRTTLQLPQNDERWTDWLAWLGRGSSLKDNVTRRISTTGSQQILLNGIPIAFTTAPDVLRFLDGWMDGRLPAPPDGEARYMTPGPGREQQEPVYDHGVFWERVGAKARVSLMCTRMENVDYTTGFQFFPESRAALVIWARGRWPEETAKHAMGALSQQAGVEDLILADTSRDVGTEVEGRLHSLSCENPPGSWIVPAGGPGTPVNPRPWIGSYRNGDRQFIIEERDSSMVLNMGVMLPVTLLADTYVATRDGQPLFPFRLDRDSSGRRYLFVGARAYLHNADRSNR
jgi:CubicO group peptidase (beta-lactamase class C family)